MKKTFLSLLLLLGSFAILSGQKIFEGAVTFTYEIKGDNAEMMESMMPEKMTTLYSKNGMITTMEGGMVATMMGKIVANAESGETFVVKDDEKVIYMMKKEDLENADTPDLEKAEKLGETKEILGYQCEKYKLFTEQGGQKISQYIWATKALKLPELKFPNMPQMNSLSLFNQVSGFPLQVEVAIPGMNTTMIMTASELDFNKPDKKKFMKPKGYEVKDLAEILGY